MGTGSRKHKGPNAKLREKIKGANQGQKRTGTTKPSSSVRAHFVEGSINKFSSKKAKKAKAREAAWAIISKGSPQGTSASSGGKAKFSY